MRTPSTPASCTFSVNPAFLDTLITVLTSSRLSRKTSVRSRVVTYIPDGAHISDICTTAAPPVKPTPLEVQF